MLKRVFGRKLSRSRPAREALFASIMRSMILTGKITTTRAKAKAVQSDLEKLVTLAKKGDLVAKRRILASLDNAREALTVMLTRVVPSFPNKTSGYTRLISLPTRRGDNAKMVRMEWTEKMIEIEKAKDKKETKEKTKKVKTKVKKNENVSAKRKRS